MKLLRTFTRDDVRFAEIQMGNTIFVIPWDDVTEFVIQVEWADSFGDPGECITDGFGGCYPKYCIKCGAQNIIVRPGDCQCSKECYKNNEKTDEQ